MRPLLLGVLVLAACGPAEKPVENEFPIPAIEWAPIHYIALKTATPPVIDGKLDDTAWERAAWTEDFGDITGDRAKAPRFRTRAKMRWDDEYLYFGFDLEENNVWGTLTERDCVIYNDNDIEVFIDPDGDTHEYYEIELNALNTVWDLLIPEPYRDGGHGVNAWDIRGMKTAVHVDGTLNDPSDEDRGWSVEMAIPWGPLTEALPDKGPPGNGDTWRVNFSRVQWLTQVVNGRYVKRKSPRTGKPLPEDNWSWSPQGIVAMHYPEMWGFLHFATKLENVEKLQADPSEMPAWELRRIYYAQRRYIQRHGVFATSFSALDVANLPPGVRMQATASLFVAVLELADGRFLSITQDGRLRRLRKESE